jgi:hypothetical protein
MKVLKRASRYYPRTPDDAKPVLALILPALYPPVDRREITIGEDS